jgi:hypothetical protein
MLWLAVLSQVSQYDWGTPGYQPGTGHFTQMVWRRSTKLGCAESKGCDWKTYVCMYNPAGVNLALALHTHM